MFLENPVFIVVAPVIFQIPGNWSLLLCLPCCSWGSECAQVKVNLSKPSIFTSTSCKCWLPRYCHHVASNCLPKDHAVHLVLLDMLRHQRRQGPQRARRTQQTMGRDPHCYCSDRFSLWICFHCFIFYAKNPLFAAGLISAINMWSVRWSARLQNVLTVAKLVRSWNELFEREWSSKFFLAQGGVGCADSWRSCLDCHRWGGQLWNRFHSQKGKCFTKYISRL